MKTLAAPALICYNHECKKKTPDDGLLTCAYSSEDRAPASGAGCAGSSPARRTIFYASGCIRVRPPGATWKCWRAVRPVRAAKTTECAALILFVVLACNIGRIE